MKDPSSLKLLSQIFLQFHFLSLACFSSIHFASYLTILKMK
jgi:hypothetical protein